MKASDYIADYLEYRGVEVVFELVGGMITHMVDSLHRRGKIKILSVHHEQAAAFAADAHGRVTGVPGVAMATSGPGATNLLTGIGSCYFDSSPAVFITGQVNRSELKGDRAIRQLGFQETDIVSMARPITKDAIQIQDPSELPGVLAYAFDLAVSGRPGPVLIDIPMDVQRADVPEELIPARPRDIRAYGDAVYWKGFYDALERSDRPLIIAGAGVRAAGAAEAFRQFVNQAGIPVVNSLNGVDLLPYDHPMRVGMLGSYGNRWANLAIGESDLLLVLGSRLDIRQTGADTDSFKADRTVIHVDCERGEINNRVLGCEAVVADVADFLAGALVNAPESVRSNSSWIRRIDELKAEWPDTEEITDVEGINPNKFLHALSRGDNASAAYLVDVGQHQMWAAQSVEVSDGQRFMTSGGMGSMGFALPAAIGAAMVSNGRPVVVIAGDGGFQCNIQELQTIVRNKLPVKIVILNNRCHGMVRQFQQSYFDERYQSTLWGYDAPDFAAVAGAYGIPGRTVECETDVDAAVAWLHQERTGPALLQVMIDTEANAYPKIAFGRPMTEMEPYATPIEMEGT